MTDTELTLSERIQRLGNPGISSHDVVAEDDVYDSEDYQAFVYCRGVARRAETLNLQFKDGSQVAIAYSHFYRASFDPERGIRIVFSEHDVVITGQGLLEGYRRILGQRVLQVCEADGPTIQLAEQAGLPCISKITVNKCEPKF